mmetsp:Transcript_11178/g.38072  ORF Transcript_11178/g.38072 Transcript_11178/m.38072 type:complete len:221 (+) Transcript_11178:472-1134(+)
MFLDQLRLHTWEPVSTQLSAALVCVFQNRMQRSAVPPPDASRPFWCGDHAIAFTAAVCSLKRSTGLVECGCQTKSLLSLPPEASCRPSWDHLRPHTSCLWPVSLYRYWSGTRASCCRMLRSRDPEESMWPAQHMVPTRPWCPVMDRTREHRDESHTWTSPWLVPTARCVPRPAQDTEVTVSSGPRSHSLITLLVHADQRYTQVPRPTASTLSDDQSTRLR